MLQVEHLRKRFGDIQAVDRVSFQVEAGEIYGLLGPNGAGKTTCIAMICGLLRPDDGSVVVDGLDFWSQPTRAQQLMGVVPQEVALYEELSGEDNLIFWGKLAGLSAADARSRSAELLEALNLTDRRKDIVKNYSGGMQRRINLGCALLHRPKLLLLDEPTVGIDPQARAKILDFVRERAAEGTSILYTTHYLEEAETLCDRIGILDHGQLLAEGTLNELQAKLGGDRLYVIDGQFHGIEPTSWDGFVDHYHVIQHRAHQLVLASRDARHPAECLRELLELPAQVENVTVKKPTLNDVFLQLTGRELRE